MVITIEHVLEISLWLQRLPQMRQIPVMMVFNVCECGSSLVSGFFTMVVDEFWIDLAPIVLLQVDRHAFLSSDPIHET